MPPRPDRAAARSAFLLFWHDEAEAHFQTEEQILLPALHGLDAADARRLVGPDAWTGRSGFSGRRTGRHAASVRIVLAHDPETLVAVFH
jgi:hypothetical protein